MFGCGGVGMSAVLGALAAGADPVVAVDVAPEKLAAAEALGATHVVPWAGDAEATAERVRAVSGGGVDYAFEATGRPEAALAAFLSTRARGAAVLIGIPRRRRHDHAARRCRSRAWSAASSARSTARRARSATSRRCSTLYRRGRLPLDRLVSRRLPLEAVEDAFAAMRDGGAVRVVLDLEAPA